MLIRFIAGGLIAAGFAASASAAPVTAEMRHDGTGSSGASVSQPCPDPSKVWLPGTLQIEAPSTVPPQRPVRQRFERGPVRGNCALA